MIHNEIETIVGIAVFLFIMILFSSMGIFALIIDTFNEPVFGGLGVLLGPLFILLIIIAFLERILGR